MPIIEMPDGVQVEFPDTMSDTQIRGLIAQRYPREVGAIGAAKPMSERITTGHSEFAGPAPQPSRTTAALSSAVEGMPIAGPYLQSGVENAAAYLGSKLTGEDQAKIRSEMGGMVDQSQAEYPYTSGAAGIGGGVLGTLPMIAAAPGAFGAGGGSLLARTGASALSGGVIGGADAGVRSDFDPMAMLRGAGVGTALGAIGPAAGDLIGAGVRKFTSYFGGGTPAEQNFARAAAADNVDNVGASLDNLGPDAMPMDLGPNLQRQAGALAASPGEGQQIVRSAIANRQTGAGGRVAGALDDTLGQNVDTLAMADEISAQQSAAAKPLYDAAYAKSVPMTPDLQELLSRPTVGKALKKAQSLAADEGMANATVPAMPNASAPGLSADDALAKLKATTARQERSATNALAPAAGRKPAQPMRLSEFVAANGGILDFKGEAAAVAGGVKNRFGRLVRPDGKKSLDYMREAAEEAGYLHGYTNDQYGRATVDDFLRALDDDVRGTPIYAQESGSDVANLDAWEAAKQFRDSVRSSADQVGQELSGTVSNDVFQRAVRHVEDGMPADEALQKAIADDVFENGVAPQEVPAGWFADVADNGTVSVKRPPTTRELHYTKMALDDMIDVAKRGGNNNEARIYKQVKDRLLGMVDAAVPEYKQARAAYAGPAGVKDAMEEGGAVFKDAMTPNQLRTRMLKMGDAEKEAFVQGARAQVADIMGTARNDALAARSMFQKGYNKEKLAILLGEDEAGRLLKSLDAETAFTKTRDVVTGNSETAARLAAQKEIAPGGSDSIIRNFDLSKPGDFVARIGDKLASSSREQVQGTTNAELARLLTSKDPEALTRTIKMVQAAQRRGDITAARAKEIVQALSVSPQVRRPLEITVTPRR